MRRAQEIHAWKRMEAKIYAWQRVLCGARCARARLCPRASMAKVATLAVLVGELVRRPAGACRAGVWQEPCTAAVCFLFMRSRYARGLTRAASRVRAAALFCRSHRRTAALLPAPRRRLLQGQRLQSNRPLCVRPPTPLPLCPALTAAPALAARGMKMTCRLPLCRPRHARQLCRWRRELFCVRRVIPWMVVYVWGCIGARMFCCGMGTEAAKENNRVYRDVPVSELPCQGSLQAELVVCMQGVCTRMRAAAASVILHGGVA